MQTWKLFRIALLQSSLPQQFLSAPAENRSTYWIHCLIIKNVLSKIAIAYLFGYTEWKFGSIYLNTIHRLSL